jgi:phosphate-selective porin OprO/OprP
VPLWPSILSAAADDAESSYDRLWSRAHVYTGDSESFFRSVQLSGRFQVDQAYVDGSDGEDFSVTSLRRFRLGARVDFLDDFTFHAEAEFAADDHEVGYERLTDSYIAWSPNAAVKVTVGKHSVPFTMDGQTSSKELLTIDRSNLTNNIWFTTEYIPGVSVSGETDSLMYHVGFYSSGESNRGFGDSNGGEFVLATIGHDFGEKLGAREGLLRFNFVDNEPDPNNSFTRPLERIGSLNFSLDIGRWGLRADISTATGYLGQSDLAGVMIMPYYNIGESLQLVARYTFVESDDENGVRFARYEREVVGGRGDKYREIYAGLNYYWYGHKLKLQTGLQYADMNDRAQDGGEYSGWAWTTGFRVSW